MDGEIVRFLVTWREFSDSMVKSRLFHTKIVGNEVEIVVFHVLQTWRLLGYGIIWIVFRCDVETV